MDSLHEFSTFSSMCFLLPFFDFPVALLTFSLNSRQPPSCFLLLFHIYFLLFVKQLHYLFIIINLLIFLDPNVVKEFSSPVSDQLVPEPSWQALCYLSGLIFQYFL
jgi:hypothetical protein